MSDQPARAGNAGGALLDLYDDALPVVYGYLRARCERTAVAEELTSETFLAAVDAVRRDPAAELSRAWLVGVARHKLVDHWRRRGREERGLQVVASRAADRDDPWEVQLDALRARALLDLLAPQYVLTLRYLDDLPVPQVADLVGRSVHATEGLLVRARSPFRAAYDREEA